MTSRVGGDNASKTGQRREALRQSYSVAANDINRPSPVLLMSLILPALLACMVAYYLATMPLEPAVSTVPTMPAVVISVQTMTPVVGDWPPTAIMPTSPIMPLATPVLIDSAMMIYAPATNVTVHIPLVMR